MKLKSFSVICPNCVTTLIHQQKKIGHYSHWFICTDCGYRERPYNEGITNQIANRVTDRLQFRNEKQLDK